MKKIIFKSFMFVAVAAALVACEKEEDSNSGGSGSIVGTWDQKSERYVATLNGTVVEDSTETYPAGTFIINFNSNGKGYSSDGDTVDYTFNNGILTLIDKTVNPYDTTVFNATVTSSELTMSATESDTIGTNILGYQITLKFNRK